MSSQIMSWPTGEPAAVAPADCEHSLPACCQQSVRLCALQALLQQHRAQMSWLSLHLQAASAAASCICLVRCPLTTLQI